MTAMTPLTEHPDPNGGRGWRVFLLVLILTPVLLVGGCIAFIALAPKDPANAYEAQMTSACRQAVRDELKSPTTASFSDEVVTQISDAPAFRVTGSVDADNSFGASIRNGFVCEGYPPTSDQGTAAVTVKSLTPG